jgi:hypothetical protein
VVDPYEPFHLLGVADTQQVRLPRRHRRGRRYAWWAAAATVVLLCFAAGAAAGWRLVASGLVG